MKSRLFEKSSQTPLQVLAPHLSTDTPREVREFWRLWQEEQFFECHEVLEILWRRENGARKIALNVLIHCAVAIYQHRRGNFVGAARQWLRAQTKSALLDETWLCKYLQIKWRDLAEAIESEIAPSLSQISREERARWPQLKSAIEARTRRELAREN